MYFSFFNLNCFSFSFCSDPPHLSPAGPSVTSLKSDCGVKFGPAQRKGLLKWQQVFIVLRPEDDMLYEFRTDLVRINGTTLLHFAVILGQTCT